MTAHAAAERRLAHALIFIAPALWSVNYLVARWAPGVIAPHALALGRWTVAALVLAFLATLYPSWRASRVNPAEALRYE